MNVLTKASYGESGSCFTGDKIISKEDERLAWHSKHLTTDKSEAKLYIQHFWKLYKYNPPNNYTPKIYM